MTIPLRIGVALIVAAALAIGLAAPNTQARSLVSNVANGGNVDNWASVPILGKCANYYNFAECMNGSNSTPGSSDMSQDWENCPDCCVNYPDTCWQARANTGVSPYSSYDLYIYVAAQDTCSSGSWTTDIDNQGHGYYTSDYTVTTDYGYFTCDYNHDEQVYAVHQFQLYTSTGVVPEYTCSHPSSYTQDCSP